MSEVLPPLYQAWVDDILPGSIPAESFATCSACPMIERPDKPKDEPAFLPQTKCCTFTPDLPNFTVGRILAGTDLGGAHARAVLRQRLQARVAVTPLGIHPLPIYQTLYDAASAGQSGFGRTATLRCPLYLEDGGRCGIWQHREAVCSTWFCKHERGVMGRILWRVIMGLLRAIETNLKFWCLDKAGLAAEPLAELWAANDQGRGKGLDEHALNNTASPEGYRRIWGDAGDRAEAFFTRCAELVAPLRYADVLAIGGASVAAAANAARVVYDKVFVEQPLPSHLAKNLLTLVQLRRPGEARVRHVSLQYDWLDLPASLVAELGRFDNAPVARVIDELRAEGVAVDEALLRRLLDWQVLVPA
jgi:Fe-S-cluster containining protein